MKIKLALVAAIIIGFTTGCNTTLEQRLGAYKAVIGFGFTVITNGTLTNVVGTIDGMKH